MLRIDLEDKSYSDTLLGKHAYNDTNLRIIDEPALIYNKGKLVLVYDQYSSDTTRALRKVLPSLPYSKARRLTQLVNKDEYEKNDNNCLTFGFRPANPIFGHMAGPNQFNKTNPHEYELLKTLGQELAKVYSQRSPDIFKGNIEKIKSHILPDYVIPGTPFTQGIVNWNNTLPYHFDAGNFEGNWSNMIVLREGTIGGDLIVPGLGVRFVLNDGALLFFDGQSLLHGVTPIVRELQNGFRVSVVYYANKRLASAKGLKSELNKKSKTEMKKLGLIN